MTMPTPADGSIEVGLLECIATLRDYLAEVHEPELRDDHSGDSVTTCSYCAAIETATRLLRQHGFEE
jgi:hypothetical protein